MKVWKPQTSHALRQGEAWNDLLTEVGACGTAEEVTEWWSDYLIRRHRDYPQAWSLALREVCERREDDLTAGLHHAELDEAFQMTVGAPERPTSLRGSV